MKNLILVFVFFLSGVSFCQENFTFKSGGRIIQNRNVLSTEKVREILVNNQPALDLYEAGRNKKTIGNILLYGGIGAFGFYAVQYVKAGSQEYGIKDHSLLIGGCAAILISIPIKIGFSNKIKQALVLMNQDLKLVKTTNIETTDLVINSNGIGLSITF